VVLGATPDKPASTNSAATVKTPIKTSDLFNTVVAKGSGVSITRAQLDDALIGIKSSAAASGRSVPPEQMMMLEQQVLQRLIQVALLNAKATAADKAAGKESADKRIAEIKTKAGSEELLTQRLKSVGLTREELNSKLNEEATAEAVLKRELKVSVSDEEAKTYYDEHAARFEQPEMVRAAHILLMTQDATGQPLADDKKAEKKKQAEGLLKRAKAGEDFAKLAEQYSEDPGSKDKGGEYKFPRGQMVPEFETVAFSLGTNQVSDIVTTQFGYHIIKLYEKFPAKKLAFDEVKTDLKEGLTQQAMQKQIPDYMEKLEKEAKVEILDERLKPAKSELEEEPAMGISSNSAPVVTTTNKPSAK
ncbi:MAG: peptidyl-prolyl cis-trans isomerase, partial [Verrucomicrobiota bacterium]